MLSPGKYHLDVPRDPAENVRYRIKLLRACAADRRLRRGVVEMCRTDILFWINSFVWQYNPLKLGHEYGPFITWGFQEEALCGRNPEKPGLVWCMENERPVVIEKSREMGGTYLCVLLQDWLGSFHRNKNMFTISRSETAVDKAGDPNCVFWKLDEVHRFLPDWMRGRRTRRKLHFGFKGTNSRITGAASTGKAGVGGRASMVFVDEFSLILEDRQVRQRAASTSNFRVFNGTHQGLHTEFWKLVNDPEYVKIVMHWTQHPDKVAGLYEFDPVRPGQPIIHDKTFAYPPDFEFVLDGTPTGGPRPGVRSPWYDKKAREIGDARAVAMELDINPTGSVSQVANAVMIQGLVHRTCRPPVWRGDLAVDSDTREGRLVADPAGPLLMWVHPRAEGRAPPGKFAVGGDLAAGTGRTPSVFSGGDVSTGVKVFEYVNPNIYPQDLAPHMVAMCRHFADAGGSPAFLGWEQQGPGEVFGIEVIRSGFRNFYHNTDPSRVKAQKKVDKPGWYPGVKQKVLLIRNYLGALESGRFENPSKVALLETLKLMWANGEKIVHPEEIAADDPAGAGANHADRCVADALLCMLMGPRGQRAEAKKQEVVPYNSFLWRRLQRQREHAEAFE